MPDNLAGLFLLDPDVVFLNHGSFGACPKPVFSAYQAWQLKLERQPVAFLDPLRGYGAWMKQARVALGHEIGASPDDIIEVARQNLASYQKPRSVTFVAELPKAPTGKILKRKLREPYWEGAERQV